MQTADHFADVVFRDGADVLQCTVVCYNSLQCITFWRVLPDHTRIAGAVHTCVTYACSATAAAAAGAGFLAQLSNALAAAAIAFLSVSFQPCWCSAECCQHQATHAAVRSRVPGSNA